MKRYRTVCWTPRDCKNALETLSEATLIANDIETIPFNKKKPAPFVMTVNAYSGLFNDGSVHSFAFPFQRGKSLLSGPPDAIESIYRTSALLNDLSIPKTYQNGVYDCAWHLYYGLPVRNYAYDTMSMWWSIYPDLPRRLDFISSILLDDYQYWKGDRKSEDFDEYLNYAMSDTESTLRNTVKLIQMLSANERSRINFFHAHMRCLTGLSMSAKGIAVDESVMTEIKGVLDEQAVKTLESLRYLVADPAFNPNSPAQKKFLIYELLGAPLRNQKGRHVKRITDASTGAIPLRSMRSDHPIFRRVAESLLAAQVPSKQISNVVGLARFPAGSTGSRFLTSYDGVGTTTSRLSSRASAFGHGGNGQNVRKDYRRFGRAEVGHIYVEIDFSAADDVFVAYESGDEKKIELVLSGKDTHAQNASILFTNWTYEEVVDGKNRKDPAVVHPITGVRQITKKVVHGTHYLMAALTMYNNAGRDAIVAAALAAGFSDAKYWPQKKLVEFCDVLSHRFRNHYTRFMLEQDSADSWYRELRQEVIKTGGFTTPFRYFQSFSSDPKDDATLRAVAATAGQAGTAGRINMVMEELTHGFIPRYLRDGENPNYGDRPNLIGESLNGISMRQQTHDSGGFDLNPMHPNWISGLDGVIESFSRPIMIKGREVRVGIEIDVSIFWAGKETKHISKAEDLIPILEEWKIPYAA